MNKNNLRKKRPIPDTGNFKSYTERALNRHLSVILAENGIHGLISSKDWMRLCTYSFIESKSRGCASYRNIVRGIVTSPIGDIYGLSEWDASDIRFYASTLGIKSILDFNETDQATWEGLCKVDAKKLHHEKIIPTVGCGLSLRSGYIKRNLNDLLIELKSEFSHLKYEDLLKQRPRLVDSLRWKRKDFPEICAALGWPTPPTERKYKLAKDPELIYSTNLIILASQILIKNRSDHKRILKDICGIKHLSVLDRSIVRIAIPAIARASLNSLSVEGAKDICTRIGIETSQDLKYLLPALFTFCSENRWIYFVFPKEVEVDGTATTNTEDLPLPRFTFSPTDSDDCPTYSDPIDDENIDYFAPF